MKKIVMILVIVAMCASSFGEVLVYRVSDSMSGFTVGPSWGAGFAKQFRGSINGYVVVDVNTTTLYTISSDPNDPNNPNNHPAFIAVKDRSFVAFDGNNPKAQTEFVLTLDPNDPDNTKFNVKFEIRTKSGKATKKVIVLPQFYFVYNATSPNLTVEFFQTQGALMGQLDTVDIGLPVEAVIPRSIKGQAHYNVVTDYGGSQNSIGNVSFTLDNSFTRTANTGPLPMTVSETIDYIQQKLVDRGYREVTFVQFFGKIPW